MTKARVFCSQFYNTAWAVSLDVFEDMEEKIKALFGSKEAQGGYIAAMDSLPEGSFGFDSEGKPLLPPEGGKTVVLEITGILEENLSFFGWLFGGVSTSAISKVIGALVDDATVENIVLSINSPGGEIGGIANLAQMIYGARDKKNIVAVIGTVGASGAYWIASAASKLYISSPTSQIGSIGVVIAHRDISKAEEKRGVKTTEVTAGKFKRVVSGYKPLDDEGLQELRVKANKFYQPFLKAISEHRGIGEIESRAEGRIFVGEEGINNNLADGFSTVNEVLQNIEKENTMADEIKGVQAPVITAESLKEHHPKVYGEVLELGKKVERERIQGIEDVSLPGFESIVDPVKFDGKTTGDNVAGLIVREQKANRGPSLDSLKGDSIKASHDIPKAVDEGKEVEALASAIAGEVNKPRK